MEETPAIRYQIRGEILEKLDSTMACKMDASELRTTDLATQIYALMLLSYHASTVAWQLAAEYDSLDAYYQISRDVGTQGPDLENIGDV